MTRNAKAAGLLIAIWAVGLIGASEAQANSHKLTVPLVPAIVTASDHESSVFTITGGEHEVSCGTTKYEGTVSEKEATELTIRPTYSECKVDGDFGPTATIDVNHCAYVLGGKTDANGDAKAQLECAEGSEITITYSVIGSSCVIHVPVQTPKAGVHYTEAKNGETGKQDLTIKFTASGLKYTETGGGFCPETHTGEDGVLTEAVTAQAYIEKDFCAALEGTEKTTPINYYKNCEGSAQDLETTKTHHITTPSSPAIVTANQEEKGEPVFVTGGGNAIKCEKAEYEGTGQGIEVTVTPTFSGCTNEVTGQSATVTVNHCAYVFSGETDANGDGQTSLECAEGNEVVIHTNILSEECTIKIKPQVGKGGTHYTQTKNATTGKQDLTVKLTASGIEYTTEGPAICNELGNGKDGELTGALTAEAYKDDCGSGLSGTERTTPGNHYDICEGTVQDLELTTTQLL